MQSRLRDAAERWGVGGVGPRGAGGCTIGPARIRERIAIGFHLGESDFRQRLLPVESKGQPLPPIFYIAKEMVQVEVRPQRCHHLAAKSS